MFGIYLQFTKVKRLLVVVLTLHRATVHAILFIDLHVYTNALDDAAWNSSIVCLKAEKVSDLLSVNVSLNWGIVQQDLPL